MSKELVVGIIGCGQIGKHHIERYRKMPGVRIAAVCDILDTALSAGVELSGGARPFVRFRDLLKLDEIEAVDVCLHNNLHAPVTLEALAAGKHVYCEKPMAGAYADAAAMAEAAKKSGLQLSIQLGHMFSPEFKAAKRIIDAGQLGRPYFARSVGFRRRGRCYVDGYGSENFVRKPISGGGALYDMGVYHISQMLHLLGNPPPRTISGSTYQEIDMYPARRQFSGYSVEELGLGYVRLDGDQAPVTLLVEEAWAIHLGSLGSPCVVGPRGGLSFNPLTLHSTVADVEVNAVVETKLADARWHNVDPDYAALDSAQAHWAAMLRGLSNPIDTVGLALNTMLISEGIYLSHKLGREVTADEVRQMSKSTAVEV